MRKDWIRTDEEKQLRQLQKFAKEQRKLNKSVAPPILNLPLVVRKKKRLTMRPLIPNLIMNPVKYCRTKKNTQLTFIFI